MPEEPTKYVLLTMEDYIISETVDNEEIEKIIDFMNKNNIKFCKLNQFKLKPLKGLKKTKFANIYYMEPNLPYGLSCNVGIFRCDYLRELIGDKNILGWGLEEYFLDLACQSKNENGICTIPNPLHTVDLMKKGKLVPSAVKKLQKCNINMESVKRYHLNRAEVLSIDLRAICSSICPSKARTFIKKVANSIGVKTTTKQ